MGFFCICPLPFLDKVGSFGGLIFFPISWGVWIEMNNIIVREMERFSDDV